MASEIAETNLIQWAGGVPFSLRAIGISIYQQVREWQRNWFSLSLQRFRKEPRAKALQNGAHNSGA
jgi:hypothetical protein